jgi:stearoyl-CoA 9-desaturase NADPH oxidoreductase
VDPAGLDWVAHRPGQYVRVGVEVDGVRHWRTYSLTSVPARADGRIAITVKVVADGLVSTHLVRRVARGTIVRLAPRPASTCCRTRRPPGCRS